MNVLEMRHVDKHFRSGEIQTYALKDFSLDIAEGDFVAVEGPSGAGKTTFLNVAGLLDTLDAGSYTLVGNDVSKLSDRERSLIRNRQIGFIFQGFNLIPDLSAAKNVELPLRLRGMPAKERKRRVGESLERVGLDARAKHLPSQLSGGQQQRVAVARALAGEPSLILADEPTGNLDSKMAMQIMAMLAEINRAGTTIVMVTHSNDCASKANRRVGMRDGSMVGEG